MLLLCKPIIGEMLLSCKLVTGGMLIFSTPVIEGMLLLRKLVIKKVALSKLRQTSHTSGNNLRDSQLNITQINIDKKVIIICKGNMTNFKCITQS